MNAPSKQQLPQELIKNLQSHAPLHIVCDYLKFHKKPTAKSWETVFERNASERILLLNLLTEILCFGKKSIYVYDAENVDLSPLNDAQFTQIDILQALKNTSTSHTLFRREADSRFSSFSFVCKKTAYETYVLTQSDLSASAMQKFWTPDAEVKLKAKIQVNVFDSLVYDAQNKLLFVVLDNSRYSFEESAFDRQSEFIVALHNTCPSLSKIKLVDLFSCVEGIYQKASEGIIHRLAFECNTGAVRDEKLKQGQLDLRTELYHTSGKAAIGGDIRPYKVGVTWHPSKYSAVRSEVDIEINGNRRNLHQQGGIYSCDLRSIGTFNELCFALDRVVLYVEF